MQLRLNYALSALLFPLMISACDETDPMPSPSPSPNPAAAGHMAIRENVSATASMMLSNRYTNATITGLYVSPVSRDVWGANLLDRVLGPGNYVIVEGIPCNDRYDMRVNLTVGPPLVMKGVRFECGTQAALTVP